MDEPFQSLFLSACVKNLTLILYTRNKELSNAKCLTNSAYFEDKRSPKLKTLLFLG